MVPCLGSLKLWFLALCCYSRLIRGRVRLRMVWTVVGLLVWTRLLGLRLFGSSVKCSVRFGLASGSVTLTSCTVVCNLVVLLLSVTTGLGEMCYTRCSRLLATVAFSGVIVFLTFVWISVTMLTQFLVIISCLFPVIVVWVGVRPQRPCFPLNSVALGLPRHPVCVFGLTVCFLNET